MEPDIASPGTLRSVLPRVGLQDEILARPEAIIVLDATAGMGKSVLLAQLGARLGIAIHRGIDPPELVSDLTLWDVPVTCARTSLPEGLNAHARRLIIAKRPETSIDGLSREVAYGHAAIIDSETLLFTRDELAQTLPRATARRLHEQTGGWPLLLRFPLDTPHTEALLVDLLSEQMLARLPARTLVALGEAVAGRTPVGVTSVSLAPLIRFSEDGRPFPGAEALAAPLKRALDRTISQRRINPEESEQLAAALLDHGRTTDAILLLQGAGLFQRALDILVAAKGYFYIYRFGAAAFDAILACFPAEFGRQHEALVLCYALQALKRGDLARARQVIDDFLGDIPHAPDDVFSDRPGFSSAYRFFRVLMLIYEDLHISEDLYHRVFSIISELPAEAHLERGSFYNSLLEFYIRGRRFAEAEDVAVRAQQHYAAANVPILQFYISLHRAVMRLMQADVNEARRFADEAAGFLAACGFESPNDARLVVLLRACVEYEGGHAEPLAKFLSTDLDEFSHAEIWPTIIDLALHYGSQALSEHFSTFVARSFLDRWRVYQVHNRQFQAMIDIREATVLQNGNRWQEAAEKLSGIVSPITREWVLAASTDLALLEGRDDIALALAWLRQMVFETPGRAELHEQLQHVLANQHVTGRQRVSVEIWQAFLFRSRRDLSRSRSGLLTTLERAARLGAQGPLAEERYFLAELIGNRRTLDFLQGYPQVRNVLRRLTDRGVVSSPAGVRTGLSRREAKVLMLISEGNSNKRIANALGVTEATVKYHLSNVYRKLGCSRRREAIDAARALGLVN